MNHSDIIGIGARCAAPRRSLRAALALAISALALSAAPAAALALAPCPNESSRVGASAGLPDCRAYELITPGLNGAAPPKWPAISVQGIRADGSALAFIAASAPAAAEGAPATTAMILAARGAAGWSTRSLSAPTPLASGTYFGEAASTVGLSTDLTQSVLWSNQPLAGGASPSGANLYLRRADGSVAALTKVGAAGLDPGAALAGASRDFTRLFLATTVKQPVVGLEDPLLNGNLYEYAAGQLRLVTILPESSGEEAAPAGGTLAQGVLPAISDDGSQVLFKANLYPGLYLRLDGAKSVEVSKSQRATPDPDPPAEAVPAGISSDGSTVLFTSVAKLTDDPGVGPTDDTGADLYSYDVATEVLTDLTTDTDPIPEQTSADVEAVLGASPDASYVYFVAKGNLAPGATSGARNLYVAHAGAITYVAADPQPGAHFYVTPDGLHAAFTTTAPQGTYDNAGLNEAYRYTYAGALQCASCRPDGTAPSAGAAIAGRALSDDGAHFFFQSADAILPAAQSGGANVYEYSGGAPQLLTPGDGPAALLLGAGSSGEDVFIATHQELSPQGQGAVFAIYDARVNAQVPVPSVAGGCQGEGCRGAAPAAPEFPGAGSAGFEAPGRVSAPALKVVRAAKVQLRLIVPGPGELTVGGRGFDPVKKQAARAGATTVALALKPGPERKRQKQGVFRTEAEILFRSAAGGASRASVELAFEAASQHARAGR